MSHELNAGGGGLTLNNCAGIALVNGDEVITPSTLISSTTTSPESIVVKLPGQDCPVGLVPPGDCTVQPNGLAMTLGTVSGAAVAWVIPARPALSIYTLNDGETIPTQQNDIYIWRDGFPGTIIIEQQQTDKCTKNDFWIKNISFSTLTILADPGVTVEQAPLVLNQFESVHFFWDSGTGSYYTLSY